MKLEDRFADNLKIWDEKTPVHAESDFYDLEGFKAGKNTLVAPDLAALGDVSGLRLLHLQCHFGLDTLSWARLGAEVTGMDFSPVAIAKAREIAAECGIPATFIESNLYDFEPEPEAYDIVYTSYGVIGWLPDLGPWAEKIAAALKSGGRFYMAEFHPILWTFDEALERFPTYSYFNDEVIESVVEGTYADREAPIGGREHGWNHPTSEVLNALCNAGLRLRFFNEYPYSPYDILNKGVQGADGMWRHPEYGEKLPWMFDLLCAKD